MFDVTINSNCGKKNIFQSKTNPFTQKKPVAFEGELFKKLSNDTFIKSQNRAPISITPDEDSFTAGLNKIVKSLKGSKNGLVDYCSDSITNITSSLNNICVKNKNQALETELLSSLKNTKKDDLVTSIALLGKLKSKESIPFLVEMLEKNSTPPQIAVEIIYSLANIGDAKVLQPMIDILTDDNKDPNLRAVTAISLGKMKNRKASKPLFEVLRNENDHPIVRAYSALSLSEFPTIRNTEQLVKSLEDPSEHVRANSALALGIIGHKEAIPKINNLLNDSNPTVKANAALSLGNMKAEEAIPNLVNALEETEQAVIISIARALYYINPQESAKELIKTLDNTSNSATIRRNSAACLQMMNCKDAVDTLNNILGDKNEDLLLRNYALNGLLQLRAPKCLENLKAILNDNTENYQLQVNAAAGIGIIGTEKEIDLLLNIAQSTEIAELKNNSINGIRSIVAKSTNKESIDSSKLLPLLNDPDPRIKALIADSLGYLKANEAVKPLLNIITDPKEHVMAKVYSISALANIGDKSVKDTLLNVLTRVKEPVLASRAASALYVLGFKDDLFNIVKSDKHNYDVKNQAAGVLIAMGERSKKLETFLKPGLNVQKLHQQSILGQGIEVAVIDEQVDPSHPEFDNRIVIEPLEHHGTMVSGKLGGNVSGVAPKAVIHTYNVFDSGSDQAIVQALEKIIDQKINGENNIKVVNMSLGFTSNLIANPGIQQLINKFDQLAKIATKLGITIVVAAGNDGRNMPIPTLGTINLLCLSDAVIAVGATTANGTPDDPSDDTRADFSSYPGEDSPRQLDVMAPGHQVTLPFVGGSYRTVDGTSFSAPFVAGLVSLMYQVNPDIKPAEIKEILKETATELNNVPKHMQGSGEVNPMLAVVKALHNKDSNKALELAKKLGIEKELEIQQNLFTNVA